LYEMTGNTKYWRAAIRCAEALVKNFKPGDKDNSPWPFRWAASLTIWRTHNRNRFDPPAGGPARLEQEFSGARDARSSLYFSLCGLSDDQLWLQ
jgi:hypothetical protein